jgi:hypothetical protein
MNTLSRIINNRKMFSFVTFFAAASVEPTKPPLTTKSDEAMAMVNKAAVLFFVNIPIDHKAYSLRNLKVNRVHSIPNIFREHSSAR